jgi:hypothetical protein
MRITNNFYQQYTSNYKKMTKQDNPGNKFADILNGTQTNEFAAPPAQKSPAPVKGVGFYPITATYSTPQKIESIYDIPCSELELRLRQAVTASSNIDTAGLTQAEIYNRVKSIFAESLGRDFLEPSIIYEGTVGLDLLNNEFPVNTFLSISTQFHLVLRREHGVLDGDFSEARQTLMEAKGFAGLSESELRTAVRSQYSENMTLKDVILMSHELGQLGLETTAYGRAATENIFTRLGFASSAPNTVASAREVRNMFDAMLNQPASFENMKMAIEAYRQPGGGLTFSFDITSSMREIFDDLLMWIGGRTLYSDDMLSKLMEMLQEIRKI